jgi:hypothetical protein
MHRHYDCIVRMLPFFFVMIAVEAAGAEDKPALPASQTNQVLSWIAKQVASERQPYCYRQTYTRSVGEPISTCGKDKEPDGALCYPKCKEGYNIPALRAQIQDPPLGEARFPLGFRDREESEEPQHRYNEA